MHQSPVPPAHPTAPALLRLYRPEEIAEALGCSAWWVKDRASRALIPFTRVGRAYRFTSEHVAEIVRLYETRPPSAPSLGTRAVRPLPPLTTSVRPAAGLRARPPRRTCQDGFNATA
ncbi:helix-turn-helix domain-containing protein [Streptomyces sp. NRRL S-378]|uniref:helix-turn-helix domain-containing protein n=1 Tax=Streptomyces sp. NRRL S-378 TaxID=1463904 RepID=UPI0005632198|nr:helix-turn-helix domain-containing protein [Streptomyces sp. NRRL S-378]